MTSAPGFSDALPVEEPLPATSDFGEPQVFVPQKTRALRRAFLAAGLMGVAALAGLTLLIASFAI